MATRLPYLLILMAALLRCDVVVTSEVMWRWPNGVTQQGEFLQGHVIQEFTGAYVISQCAWACFYDNQCESFNYHEEAGRCQLSDSRAEVSPDDVITQDGSVYVEKQDLSAGQDILGACVRAPCLNGGVCLDIRGRHGNADYVCACSPEWTGTDCQTAALVADWSDWEEWSSCSVTCGEGWSQRERQCRDASTGAGVDSELCVGDGTETRQCFPQECPEWSDWEDWSTCSTADTCGPGETERGRVCLHNGRVGVDRMCMGPETESKSCDQPSCTGAIKLSGDVVGEGYLLVNNDLTSTWGHVCSDQWETSDSDVACRQLGYQSGAAATTGVATPPDNQLPYHLSGVSCAGDESSIQACTHTPWQDSSVCAADLPAVVSCIVDGGWSNWSDWGTCSVTCADGESIRTRTCDSPAPARGGADCEGEDTQTRPCTEVPCPVDGEWNDWSDWSACNKTCGGGWQGRERTCGEVLHGGTDCQGESTQQQQCNTQECPVDGYWDVWAEWESCDAECDGGRQVRRRECVMPQHGGDQCDGEGEEWQDCNTHNCPEDCFWHEWDSWQECNVTCGDGHQMRSREQTEERYGGEPCAGEAVEWTTCNPRPCPVDGYWSNWSDWGTCSLTCGNGTQNRTRDCTEPLHGGAHCNGEDQQVQECFLRHCPVDGVWLPWQPWETCNVTCGGGYQMRSRDCQEAQHGGVSCEEQGEGEEWRNCNDNPCPVDGAWTLWTRWFECSATCAGGLQSRYRNCTEALHGGRDCDGAGEEQRECNTQLCPIDGYWGDWGEWSTCSEACAGGRQYRTRECVEPLHGGLECRGPTREEQDCNMHECPVNGYWTMWTEWGVCSEACGGGNQTRNRSCVEPLHGGATCEGEDLEQQQCNTHPCPIDGVYNEWSEWGTCSRPCGGGEKTRNRECTSPQHGGRDCDGEPQETTDCNTHECPVDCLWREWSAWGDCSVSCGDGEQNRSRGREPERDGGESCVGEDEEVRHCNLRPCPVDCVWHEWEEWETCNVTCGEGHQRRSRTKDVEQHGGEACVGGVEEWRDCFPRHCPVDCVWSDWSDWEDCTVTCGDGTQNRSRTKEDEQHGGVPCDGEATEERHCNPRHCPIDGVWDDWSEWTVCTTTCGGGTTHRNRTCTLPQHGGLPCDGPDAEILDCNENPCPIPGEWSSWEQWTDCTTTCGTGSRDRVRQCNMTSYGDLTDPCIGDNHTVADCHTWPCDQYMASCGEYLAAGLVNSAHMQVRPVSSVFEVHCNMSEDYTNVFSIFHHDFEERVQVQGFEAVGEYRRDVSYIDSEGNHINIDDLAHYIDTSTSCRQFIMWECYAAAIHSPITGSTTTYWVDRDGDSTDYWGGAPPGSRLCECGANGACANETMACNCDMNDEVWRVDKGYIINKDQLPISQMRAGDTGRQLEEIGYFTVGPVECWSQADHPQH